MSRSTLIIFAALGLAIGLSVAVFATQVPQDPPETVTAPDSGEEGCNACTLRHQRLERLRQD